MMKFARATLLATGATVTFAAPAFAQDGQQPAAPEDAGAIVVTGIRDALTNAINVKRNADAVVDVITAEGIGSFPTATSRNRCRTFPASASTGSSASASASRSRAPIPRSTAS